MRRHAVTTASLALATSIVFTIPPATAADLQRCTDAIPCIAIDYAWYGAPGDPKRTCDATSLLRGGCNRRLSCEIEVNNGLCGDPAPGVVKQIFVQWKCTGDEMQRFDSRREGGMLKLGCGF